MESSNYYAVFSHSSTSSHGEKYNGNSLTLLVGNLTPEENLKFVSFLTNKLSQKFIPKDECHIFPRMPLTDGEAIEAKRGSCFCYSSTVKSSSSSLAASTNEWGDSANIDEVHTSDIIICLIAHQKVFDVFNQELSVFCQNTIKTFNWEICELKYTLDKWLQDATGYLTRTINAFGENMAYLFEMALYGYEPVIINESNHSPVKQEDIIKVMEIISIKDLIPLKSQLQLKLLPQPTFVIKDDIVEVRDSPTPHELSVGWADKILSASKPENSSVIAKEIFNLFHIKLIQALNSLKRYVRESEENYYSLYRTYKYLRGSGVPNILLFHIKNEDGVMSHGPSSKVIEVLETMFKHESPAISAC